MGKSPGKWFRAVLFGKRSSGSNLSKGKETTKSAMKKTTSPANKEPAASLPVEPPVISEPLLCPTAVGKQNPGTEKVDNASLPSTGSILSSQKQDEEAVSTKDLNKTEDSNRMMLEQAAIKAQAAFRGFLARRAFKTLQGIIRLQAIIRGHLVRRQAVATLYCVQGIVKLQALVRGHMVRRSDIGIQVCSKSNQEKQDVKRAESCITTTSNIAQSILKNAFVGKLLSMSHTAMPLRLQYGTEEPNSAWDWLLRWTVLHVWEPLSEPKKDSLKHQRFQTGQASAKQSGRRVQSASLENGTNHSASDSKKTKRKPRSGLDHSANTTKGHPQNEIEKIKRSLKKVSQPTKNKPFQVEVDSEQPRRTQRKSHKLSSSEHVDSRAENPSDKLRIEMEQAVTKSTDGDTFAELPATDFPVNDSEDHPVVSDSDQQLMDDQTGNDKNKNEDPVDQTEKNKRVMDNQTDNENHKISKRRASLPAKHDDLETGLPSATKVPSYMAATESAKAKVRGQVSPRFGQDGYEKNDLTRRYSLPSSTNAKLSSSPRVHRLVQASGRGGAKIDRSLSSSRDDKSIQEWRR